MKNILFSILVIFIFFAVLEIISRILLNGKDSVEEANIQYIVDKDLLWLYKPDQYISQPSKGVDYQINSEGLRCSEFPVKKPAGERRLLAIGDSVTFGHLVSEGNTYPQILEKYLSESLGDKSIRVINGGVNAYSTREELMFLQKKGINYDPDMVILGFILNDASIFSRNYQLEKFQEIVTKKEQSDRLRRIQSFLTRLHFARGFNNLIEKVIFHENPTQERREKQKQINRDIMYLESDEAIEGWELTMNELGEATRLLKNHDIDMVIVFFPYRRQLEEIPTPNRPQIRLKEFCESNDILYLDVLPVFLDHSRDSLFLDHIHLSREGNSLVAEKIGYFLIEKGLLNN